MHMVIKLYSLTTRVNSRAVDQIDRSINQPIER